MIRLFPDGAGDDPAPSVSQPAANMRVYEPIHWCCVAPSQTPYGQQPPPSAGRERDGGCPCWGWGQCPPAVPPDEQSCVPPTMTRLATERHYTTSENCLNMLDRFRNAMTCNTLRGVEGEAVTRPAPHPDSRCLRPAVISILDGRKRA